MAGYGMTDPTAAAKINAAAAKNNAAAAKAGPVKQTTYTPTQLQDLRGGNFQSLFPGTSLLGAGDKAKLNMIQFGASHMPSVNPTAQTTGAGVGTPWASGMVDWVRKGYEDAGVDTSSVPLWGGGIFQSKNSGSGTSGIGMPSGGGMSAAGGGGLGGLGSMLGGGGMGGMGGMSGIGDALGGILGGGAAGGGGATGGSGAPAVEEKAPDKPIPQRYWAGGYNSEQQAAMNAGGSPGQMAKLKADFDRQNIENFKGMQGYDDLKKDRVKQAQQLAERQGGQYDTEGNYYSKDVLGGVIADETKKRAQADANNYDVPSGAIPVAGNANDKTPPGSVAQTPAASGGGGSTGSGSGSKKKAGGLDSDWLKKLGGMASSWFGGM